MYAIFAGIARASQGLRERDCRLTLALNTNADQLIFDPDEHTPDDWQLRLQAITHLDPDEQHAIRTVIDGILIRHQARKLAS